MAVYEYRIHPSVGIARMGDSEHAYFLGREAPGDRFEPDLKTIPGKSAAKLPGLANFPFRDKDKKLAKQGARFRVYCYEYNPPPPFMAITEKDKGIPDRVWEVTADNYTIEWTVEVANKKSYEGATNRPNTPAAKTFKTNVGADLNPAAVKVFTGNPAGRLDLGSAFMEPGGRLIVLGSNGTSRPIPGLAAAEAPDLRWKNWEDDVADGQVRARVTPKVTSPLPDKTKPATDATSATVIIGLPAYGMDTVPSINLYHLALNHALTSWSQTQGSLFSTAFHTQAISYHGNIEPLLKAYVSNRYVSGWARLHSAVKYSALKMPPSKADAQKYARVLRPPWKTTNHISEDIWNGQPPRSLDGSSIPVYGNRARRNNADSETVVSTDAQMPRLRFAAVPELIYKWVQDWAAGGVPAGNQGIFDRTSIDPKEHIWLLDMANMLHISAGSFFPGIEAGRDVNNYKKWAAGWGALGSHVDIRWKGAIGEITQNLAVPWQSDFVACTGEYWPASRPIDVTQDGTTFYHWIGEAATGYITQKDFVTKWSKMGFIRYETATDDFRERSRDLTHP